MNYPPMYRIQQRFERTSIKSIPEAVRREFSRLSGEKNIKPNQRVAVAVGSRGIENLRTIVATTVECLQNLGVKPFILPAMGSHGGATGEGQAKVLREMGITESSVGAPVISTMDVVSVGRLDSGAEVFVSKDALEADHLVVINRPCYAGRSNRVCARCSLWAVASIRWL